jgi:ring-1,2-phenylacetyl-CoA epoxidase subunit PaaC
MKNDNPVAAYALRLGDNGLVLAQRLGEWCGHAPELEIDLALANIGLDLLGQARHFLSYAAELTGSGDEDTLAFGRDERQFCNLLLAEQPNGNFADTLLASFLSMSGTWRSMAAWSAVAMRSLPPSPPRR